MEADKLQVLCWSCHSEKTKKENAQRKILQKEKGMVKYKKDESKEDD